MWEIVALILSILIFFALIKIFFVETIFDKLVILDVIDTLLITLLMTASIIFKEVVLADVAIVYALLSFAGILYFAKYIK